MSLDTITNSTDAQQPATGLAEKVFEVLASRLRPHGLCAMLFNVDGSIQRIDDGAGEFFNRYVGPQGKAINASSAMEIADYVPGTCIALLPVMEKRQLVAIAALVAKQENFSAGEDVLRICSQLGIDSQWLTQEANALPAYGEVALRQQAKLASEMLGDQAKLEEVGQELDSLSTQLAGTYEELSLIYQISGGMRINRRPADFFRQTCLDVMEVMSLRGIGVVLHQAISDGLDPSLYGSVSIPQDEMRRLGKQLFGHLAERKTMLLTNNLSQDKTFAWLAPYAQQLMAVPMQWEDRVLGCLFAIDKSTGDFDSVDSKLLHSIASESAIYLQNALLFEDVHGLMMGLLHSLTSAVDAKDAYTCGHSERVALLSRQLSKQVKLTEHDVERVYMAGLLHDVGKIGVPEHVLQKAGKLTTEEFDLMKKHPEIGARILRDIRQISDIIPGVLYHHERWDGKGYPSGLAGENIPRMGRIICLADCFDAMTSNRTYRKAMPMEVALEEIRRSAGTQFDPNLSEAFLSIGMDKIREILSSHEAQAQKLIDLQQSLRGH